MTIQGIRAAVALAALIGAPAAATTTIDFSNTGCTAQNSLYCSIPQSYGDTADVDVSYRTIDKSTGNATGSGLFEFGAYGDLTDVVYGGTDMTHYIGEITLTAKTGRTLSLRSFDFATFNGHSIGVPIIISDLAGNTLLSGGFPTLSPHHNTLNVNTDYLSGVVIRWGPDSYNVGLDNITYDIRSAVPEPATWAMMAIGMGIIGWSARRRSGRKLSFA